MKSYKVIFIGDSGVGKTSIIKAFIGEDVRKTTSTIGVDFYHFTKDGEKIVVWDFAGQEWFKDIVTNFIKGAIIVVMVFDLSKTSTLLNLINYWALQLVKQGAGRSFVLVVGNKADKKQIPDDFIQRVLDILKEKVNFRFYIETSALMGRNISAVFNNIFDLVKVIDMVVRKKLGGGE
ncbi:MAG: Rab family GTPase [Candidatus Njordarchaeales archaeon]